MEEFLSRKFLLFNHVNKILSWEFPSGLVVSSWCFLCQGLSDYLNRYLESH